MTNPVVSEEEIDAAEKLRSKGDLAGAPSLTAVSLLGKVGEHEPKQD
jgi:hypothetical protein